VQHPHSVQPRLGLLVTEVDVGAGSKYTSVKFTESLTLQGLSASIGSVGDAEDNALAVSIIRCL